MTTLPVFTTAVFDPALFDTVGGPPPLPGAFETRIFDPALFDAVGASVTLSIAVFDTAVFDGSIFDAFDAVPVLFTVTVDPLAHLVAPGQDVPIAVTIVTTTTTPGQRLLFTLTAPPQLTLYDPLGIVRVAPTMMHALNAGTYGYAFHGAPTDSPGAYTAVIDAANGTARLHSPPLMVFTIR